VSDGSSPLNDEISQEILCAYVVPAGSAGRRSKIWMLRSQTSRPRRTLERTRLRTHSRFIQPYSGRGRRVGSTSAKA